MSSEARSTWGIWTRRAAWAGAVGCLPVLLLDWPVHHNPDYHPHFVCESWWGFFCGLSWLACLVFVAVSRLWQPIVRRQEEYYGE